MTAPRAWGLLAEFESAAAIYHGCEKVRDAGYTQWDAHTPFPVHGLDRAMGIKRTILPFIVFFCGITGASGALLMQWWTSAVNYKYIIAAKPYFSWQAFVPVMFECMVLFSAAGTLLGLFHLCRLPRWHHPLFSSKAFERFSDDRFFISIEVSDPNYDIEKTRQLLQDAGAVHVEMVHDDDLPQSTETAQEAA